MAEALPVRTAIRPKITSRYCAAVQEFPYHITE
jgi:hypothetical protein